MAASKGNSAQATNRIAWFPAVCAGAPKPYSADTQPTHLRRTNPGDLIFQVAPCSDPHQGKRRISSTHSLLPSDRGICEKLLYDVDPDIEFDGSSADPAVAALIKQHVNLNTITLTRMLTENRV
jgi:hypothetical protein